MKTAIGYVFECEKQIFENDHVTNEFKFFEQPFFKKSELKKVGCGCDEKCKNIYKFKIIALIDFDNGIINYHKKQDNPVIKGYTYKCELRNALKKDEEQLRMTDVMFPTKKELKKWTLGCDCGNKCEIVPIAFVAIQQ